ncbi:MAG TPA: hypothetical protein VFJ05_03230 [Nitrososphaeraceae archaeon]|nr:hypothetical protein [Nitrososphaeraceae archaeon]
MSLFFLFLFFPIVTHISCPWINSSKNGPIRSEIQGPYEILEDRIEQCKRCIEIEVTLPKPLISNEHWKYYCRELYQKLFRYYKTYKIAKSRIDFKFEGITDLDSMAVGGGDL